MGYLEWAASAVCLVAVFLQSQLAGCKLDSRIAIMAWMYPASIASALGFAVVAKSADLYGLMALELIIAALSIRGFLRIFGELEIGPEEPLGEPDRSAWRTLNEGETFAPPAEDWVYGKPVTSTYTPLVATPARNAKQNCFVGQCVQCHTGKACSEYGCAIVRDMAL